MYIQNMNAFRQLNGRHLRSIQIVGNSQQVCQENEIHQLQIVVVGIDRSLKYRLKKYDWIKAMGLTSVDLEFVTNNVFTIDKVKFFDPEQAHYNGGAYPIPISYTFQLYLNF